MILKGLECNVDGGWVYRVVNAIWGNTAAIYSGRLAQGLVGGFAAMTTASIADLTSEEDVWVEFV